MSEPLQPEQKTAWCVVANVVFEHPFGEEQEVRKGTKHFAPGAKVFCIIFRQDRHPPQVQVIGQHRKSKRYIKVWMRLAYLANWRVELVYSPTIIAHLTNYARSITSHADGRPSEIICYSWDGTQECKQKAEDIVNSQLPEIFGAGNQPYITRDKGEEPS